ncbi:L-xylulose reductase-like [Symsagittifera roscoffensis]|uniref:L-xylulose reductase-like n=1 Tax=Symsagittifera roscoffensis TaxID=84072 RepID=UPI00307C0970
MSPPSLPCARSGATPTIVCRWMKAALDMLTQCLALELAPEVRVNSVNPGLVVTPIQRNSGMSEEDYKVFIENCEKTHLLKRVAQPEEIASVIAFVASDGASFMTGSVVPVTGGRHCVCPR